MQRCGSQDVPEGRIFALIISSLVTNKVVAMLVTKQTRVARLISSIEILGHSFSIIVFQNLIYQLSGLLL